MFTEIFNELLDENLMNMRQFSLQSGIPYPTVVGWLRMGRLPDYTALYKVADFFNCSVDFLMGRQDKEGDRIHNKATLSARERTLLENYRGLSAADRALLDQLASSLRKKQAQLEEHSSAD